VVQDTFSISTLEADIVCKFNSRVTSYSERSASLRFFSSRRVETLVCTIRAMRYLYCCFITLTLPRLASFITETLLSLANRSLAKSSSHGSPSCVTNITMLSFCAKRLSSISIMLFVLGLYAYSVLSKLGSSETFSSSLSLYYYFVYRFLEGLL